MSTDSPSDFAIAPPVEPMLAKLAEELPAGGAFLCEPKWDGFRAIVFRGGSDVFIQSRDLRPLDRYFPELHAIFLDRLPQGWVIDGEASGSDTTACLAAGAAARFRKKNFAADPVRVAHADVGPFPALRRAPSATAR
jgi:ATP-dependent DNA ligase